METNDTRRHNPNNNFGWHLRSVYPGRRMIMTLTTTIEFWQKGKWCIAKIPELDFVAQGRTIEEAKENLREVVKIQFEEMRALGTLNDYLSECGFSIHDDVVSQEFEIIGFEKQTLQVA
jgi:predicted RNase H-like HicB family nuclease